MTRTQYEEYKSQLRFGRRGIVHEGRSAASVAELDWIATNVYGLELKAPSLEVPTQQPETPDGANTPAATGEGPKAKPRARSRKPAESKPKAVKPQGSTMEVLIDGKSVDVTKLTLDGLREAAVKLGIEPGNLTKGQLLDAIAKKAAA